MIWKIGRFEIRDRFSERNKSESVLLAIESAALGIKNEDLRRELILEEGAIEISEGQLTIRKLEEEEILRICKTLDLVPADYLINDGSELGDILDNIEKKNLRKLYSQGKHDELQYYAEMGMLLEPENIDIKILNIRSLYSTGEYSKCAENCREILGLAHNQRDALRLLAKSLRGLGLEDKAAEYYHKLVELDDSDIESIISIIRHKFIRGKNEEAIEISRQSLEKDPENHRILTFLARSSERVLDFHGAIGTWKMLLSIDEEDVGSILGIGKTYYQIGNDELAKYYLERTLKLEQNNRAAKRTLMQVFSRMGSFTEAINLAKEEVNRHPSDKVMWERLISMYCRMGDTEIAEEMVLEIVRMNGGSIRGYTIAIIIATEFHFYELKNRIEEEGMSEFGQREEFFIELIAGFGRNGNLTEQIRFHQFGASTIGTESLEGEMRKVRTFLSKVGANEESLMIAVNERKEQISRTDLVVKAIVARSMARGVNTEWSDGKKLAMVSSSLGRGGSERQVVTCLDRLVQNENWRELTLYCYKIDTTGGKFQTFENEIKDIGVPIIELGSEKVDFDEWIDFKIEEWGDLLRLLPGNMRRVVEPLYGKFLLQEPSLVHSWQDGMNINSALAAMMAGVPKIVMFARSMRTDEKSILHIRGGEHLRNSYREILGCERGILAHNSSAGSESYIEWLGDDLGSFEVIHNGVDFQGMEDEEGDSEIRKEIIDLGISEDCKIVGGVFRLVEEKQPHLWIEVAEEVVNKHNNVHFVLAGGGQLLEETRAKLSQRGMSNRIHLIGQTKYVASWMKKMDVLLMTSRVEGLPNVLIEGQGFGLPIVSTDAGGSRETFVDGLTGILSQEGTKADLVKKIENVILDDEWRESASSAAREFSRKEFSIDKMYSRLEKIYGNSKKLPIPKRAPVVSIMGTCRLNLPLRKMSERGRIVLNNSGFESSYLHTTPELIRRMEVLMRRREYDIEVQRFQCSETKAINPPVRFSIEDSDLVIVEVSSLKVATFHSEPLQINNIFREFCEDRGSEGEKIREAISASLGAEYGGILGEKGLNLELFDQFELDLLDNLVLRIQKSSEVISQMKEIAELCPVPVIFLKHINVEGNDGKPIANRVLLSDYMDSSFAGLNILDPTPIVLENGREMMLEDGGVDLNHYSESGISIIGEWLLNNCLEIIGKKT